MEKGKTLKPYNQKKTPINNKLFLRVLFYPCREVFNDNFARVFFVFDFDFVVI